MATEDQGAVQAPRTTAFERRTTETEIVRQLLREHLGVEELLRR